MHNQTQALSPKTRTSRLLGKHHASPQQPLFKKSAAEFACTGALHPQRKQTYTTDLIGTHRPLALCIGSNRIGSLQTCARQRRAHVVHAVRCKRWPQENCASDRSVRVDKKHAPKVNIKPLEAIGFDYYVLEDSDVCTRKNVISRNSCIGALDRLRRAPIRGDRTRIPFDGEVMTKQIDEERRKRERENLHHAH